MIKVIPPGAPVILDPRDPIRFLLRDLVNERTGVYFEDERVDTMLEKLQSRLSENRCSTYLDYYYILKYDPEATREWRRVQDAFSVKETYFWREFDQVQALVERLIPEWFKSHATPFRIWSAACASGEEPYSIAIALAEAGLAGYPVEITGSDASEAALEKARAGVFRDRAFRSLPETLKEKYFDPRNDCFAIKSNIASRVTFRWANLVSLDEAPELSAMNVIFCRNVFIYFSTNTIKRVVTALSDRIRDDGHLFVGASESLLKLTNRFDLQQMGEAFVYARTPTA